MRKGKIFLIISIIIAVLSFLLMKGMYIIDPLTEDGGYVTTFVHIFISVPMYVIAILTFVYSIFTMIKDRLRDTNTKSIIDMEQNEELEECKHKK